MDGVTALQCPTPGKTRYLSQSSAKRSRACGANKGKRRTAYRCGCGYWHLTGKSEQISGSQRWKKL